MLDPLLMKYLLIVTNRVALLLLESVCGNVVMDSVRGGLFLSCYWIVAKVLHGKVIHQDKSSMSRNKVPTWMI